MSAMKIPSNRKIPPTRGFLRFTANCLLAAMNVALGGAQPTKEGFQLGVGGVTFGPSVAGEEPWPALPESGVDRRDHLGLIGAVSGVRFQLRQKLLDLAFDIAPRGMGLTVLGRVEPSLLDRIEVSTCALDISTALAQPSSKCERTLEEASDYAAKRGVIVVAAVGNQGTLGSTAIRRSYR